MIETLDRSPFSEQDVLNLIRKAFASWKDTGLDTALLKMDTEQWHKKNEGRTTLVSFTDEGNLLGTITYSCLEIKAGLTGAYMAYLAVNPDAGRSGVATRLLNETIKRLTKEGVAFLESDTAIRARQSVRWHRKNGFRVVGIASFSTNNYHSLLFRRKLSADGPSDNRMLCLLQMIKSTVKLILSGGR